MFEAELKYCPKCNSEYRPEIVICPACQCDLISGRELLARHDEQQKERDGRRVELSADDDLVTVRRGALAEMRVYEELLAKERIGSLLAGDESSCGKGCCGGSFDLIVRREDAHDAVEIIEAEIRRTAVIDVDGPGPNDSVFDPLASENTCPACGHCFSGGTECPDCGLCF